MVYPAQLNADILYVICESLDQQSLLALARTARSLQDPALRVLWRDIEKLFHLLSLFGSSVNRNQGEISFPCGLTSTGWERFRFYAKYVRNLHITGDDKIEQFSSLMLLPHQPLLPGLKSLVVYRPAWPDQRIFALAMFFVASIKKLTIDCSLDNSRNFLAVDQLITVLGNTAPGLRDLGIRYIGGFSGLSSLRSPSAIMTVLTEEADAPREIGGSISIFHNLCSIDIPLTSVHVHSVLSHLSTLPELSRIRFYILDLTRLSDSSSKYPFAATRSLIIMSETDDELMSFMGLTSFNNLTDLELICDQFRMRDASLFNTTSVFCGQFLNKIEIDGDIILRYLDSDTDDDGDTEDDVLNFSILYPLFKFTNLRSFSLSTHDAFWPTSEDIRNIAKSWPNLEEFCVTGIKSEGEDKFSPLTWADLLLLIDECINLKKISISVDSLEANIPNVTNSIRRPGLVIEIEISLSSIDSPKALADFLSLALPDADIKTNSEFYRCDLWEEALTLRRDKLQMALDENVLECPQN